VFDIQRTMREAYDKARRVLFESPRNDDCTSPAHKSSHVDVTSCAASPMMSLSNTGHCDGCLSTCTCFLVCTLLSLFLCFELLEFQIRFFVRINFVVQLAELIV